MNLHNSENRNAFNRVSTPKNQIFQENTIRSRTLGDFALRIAAAAFDHDRSGEFEFLELSQHLQEVDLAGTKRSSSFAVVCGEVNGSPGWSPKMPVTWKPAVLIPSSASSYDQRLHGRLKQPTSHFAEGSSPHKIEESSQRPATKDVLQIAEAI